MKRHLNAWFWACVLLAVYLGLALSSTIKQSAAWDETHYLGLGNQIWMQEDWDAPSALLHPPLSYYLAAVPLSFCQLHLPCFERGASWDLLRGVRRGQCLMRHSRPSGDQLLLLARIPTLILGLFLGYLVYDWSSRLHGRLGGMFSLFLYGLSPNVLAHSGLATPDMVLTTFGFGAVYCFWRHAREPSWIMLLIGGVALGLTLMSKHAGLLWLPVMAFLALWLNRRPLVPISSPLKGLAATGPVVHLGMITALAFLVLFLGYGLQVGPYLSGLETQGKITKFGFPAFLNGEASRSGGWWYYYVFVLLIKVPIPLLALVAGSTLIRRGKESTHLFDPLCLLVPAGAVLAAFSALTQVNVGLRYVLPAFPFLIVFAGKWIPFVKERTLLWRCALVGLLLWYGFENFSIYPHYLAYFNQAGGGPQRGYRHLVDSNLDWGQDLKGLKRYMIEKGLTSVKLSYFGTADPDQYSIRYEALPSFVLPQPAPPCASVAKGDVVAVSATNLYPLYVNLGELGEHLRSLSPVDHVGYSILIYRIERDFGRDVASQEEGNR